MKNSTAQYSSDRVLAAMWTNWVIAFGAITLPIFIAMLLPKIWIGFTCLIEGYFLVSVSRGEVTDKVSRCSLILNMTAKVLFISGAIMLLVALLCTDWLVPTVIHLTLYNSEIPFVTCLVMYPVTAVLCAAVLYLGLGSRTCRRCQRRNGFYAGDSIVATLYYKESKYQVSVLLALSLLLGAMEYWYYFTRYINSDMNVPDKFFFNWLPAIAYGLSLFFIGGRYASMKELCSALTKHEDSTVVRFLVVQNGRLLLRQNADGQWDTPAESVIAKTSSVGERQALNLLDDSIGIKECKLRYCFTNDGFATSSNIVHYAAILPSEPQPELPATDMWFDAAMIDTAMAANAMAPLLANELYRIHTITLAWKTYDENGKRRYPIKHYRPAFRLRDIGEWTVDYDDLRWFEVASNNEDRSFYRLRQFWHRMTDIFAHHPKKESKGGKHE